MEQLLPFTCWMFTSQHMAYHLRKDQNDVRAAILLDARGQPLKKRVHRTTAQLQQRLHNLCTDIRDGRKSLEVTLKGIGHCIRWK